MQRSKTGCATDNYCSALFCSVLFFSRPRSEGWPYHGRKFTFSIYLYPLSFWLTLARGFPFTSWCCPSRPCVVFLACVHPALFLVLYLSPGNSLVSSWCDYSMLASLLWRCLIEWAKKLYNYKFKSRYRCNVQNETDFIRMSPECLRIKNMVAILM